MKTKPIFVKKDEDKSKEELVSELKKLRDSHSKLKNIIARYERIALYYKSPEAAFEDLEVQRQLLYTLKEEISSSNVELSIENEELSAQVEEIIDRDVKLLESEAGLIDAKAKAELYVDLMGHDIANMNQIAMGYLELARNKIEKDDYLDKDDIEFIDKPYKSLKESSKLIENVRKIQKENAGFYNYEAIALDKILKEIVDQYSKVPNRHITINLRKAGNRCTVMANELIKDVFHNLVGNAIKHSNNTVTIDITTLSVEDNGKKYCKVTIEDNGPGIPDDLKSKLFDRLTLAGVRAKGKGFGLCLTKILVDNYQGKFFVEDRVLGDYSKGVKFVVLLPAIEN